MTTEKAPKHLGKAGRDFWNRLNAEIELNDSAEKALVVHAAECLDRIEDAKAAIKKHGAIVLDRYSQPKVSPACELERRQKTLFLSIVKQLAIDDTPEIYLNSRHKRRGVKKRNG